MKKLIALLALLPFSLFAANPSYSSFDGTQFNAPNAGTINVKSGAPITNAVLAGTATGNGGGLTNIASSNLTGVAIMPVASTLVLRDVLGNIISNRFVQNFLQPTNTYTSTASISAVVNSHVFTSTTHTFLGWHAGWQFTTIPDNQQYWVMRVSDDNTIYAFSINLGGNPAYTSVAALVSPAAEYASDDNGVKDAFSIGGDGAVLITGENAFANSGSLFFANEADTVNLATVSPGNATAHRFTITTRLGAPFAVYLSAPNESVFVNNVGAFDVNNGITNKNGNVQLLGPVQLPAQTASRALVTDGSQVIGSSATTAAELSFVSGVTSAIQTQLNAKGSGTVTSVSGPSWLTWANSATTPVAGVNGNAAAFATVTSTNGITDLASSGATATVFDIQGNLANSITTSTELAFVHGVTSAIQTQINSKGVGDAVLANNQTFTGNDIFSGPFSHTNTVNGSGTVFSNGVPTIISNNVIVAGISTNGHVTAQYSANTPLSFHAPSNPTSGIMFDAANTNDTVMVSMGTNIARVSSNSFSLFHGGAFTTNSTFATDAFGTTNGKAGWFSGTNQDLLGVTSQQGSTGSNITVVLGGNGTVTVPGSTSFGGTSLFQNSAYALFPIAENAKSQTSTREYLFKGSVSDSGSDAFYIYNGTITDGTYVPSFGGMVNSVSSSPSLQFVGYTTTGNDTGAAPVVKYIAATSTSTSDPANGTLGAFSFKPLFQWFNNGTLVMGISAAGALTVNGNTISSGTGTFTNGLVGTISVGNAAAGIIGEYVSSAIAVGSAGGMSTATATNVTSISLTAGDWDVFGNVNVSATGATITAWSAGISTTTGTLPTDGSECYSGVTGAGLTITDTVTVPLKRINVSSTTTVYLVGKSTFSLGSVSGFGYIGARRVR